MFEAINEKLDKQPTGKQAEPVQVDLRAVNTMKEQLKQAIEEARKPVNVEHHHKIEIASNWVFLSLMGMGLMILGLSYFIGNQRQIISRHKDNDLKYRYIKMQGQTNDENLYRLEKMFEYQDSIFLIRKQVGKYERLVMEQAEKLERANRNKEEVERLHKQKENIKNAR
jgi:hypothetical protein